VFKAPLSVNPEQAHAFMPGTQRVDFLQNTYAPLLNPFALQLPL